MKRLLPFALGIAALGGCVDHVQTDVPPAVVTKTVNVAIPVPCAALAKLGEEPSYADTNSALSAAPDIFETTRRLLKGREQRLQRLAQYVAARLACTF